MARKINSKPIFLLLLLVISSIFFDLKAQKMICDGSNKYFKLVKEIESLGGHVEYDKNKDTYSCIFFYDLISKDDSVQNGIYVLANSGIHDTNNFCFVKKNKIIDCYEGKESNFNCLMESAGKLFKFMDDVELSIKKEYINEILNQIN